MAHLSKLMAAADPGGGGGQGDHAPPVPVKTSHKKDGRHRRPLIFHVSCPPPPLTILDPMLDGSSNEQADGSSNDQADGSSNEQADGSSNAQAGGSSNDQADGSSNY